MSLCQINAHISREEGSNIGSKMLGLNSLPASNKVNFFYRHHTTETLCFHRCHRSLVPGPFLGGGVPPGLWSFPWGGVVPSQVLGQGVLLPSPGQGYPLQQERGIPAPWDSTCHEQDTARRYASCSHAGDFLVRWGSSDLWMSWRTIYLDSYNLIQDWKGACGCTIIIERRKRLQSPSVCRNGLLKLYLVTCVAKRCLYKPRGRRTAGHRRTMNPGPDPRAALRCCLHGFGSESVIAGRRVCYFCSETVWCGWRTSSKGGRGSLLNFGSSKNSYGGLWLVHVWDWSHLFGTSIRFDGTNHTKRKESWSMHWKARSLKLSAGEKGPTNER